MSGWGLNDQEAEQLEATAVLQIAAAIAEASTISNDPRVVTFHLAKRRIFIEELAGPILGAIQRAILREGS